MITKILFSIAFSVFGLVFAGWTGDNVIIQILVLSFIMPISGFLFGGWIQNRVHKFKSFPHSTESSKSIPLRRFITYIGSFFSLLFGLLLFIDAPLFGFAQVFLSAALIIIGPMLAYVLGVVIENSSHHKN